MSGRGKSMALGHGSSSVVKKRSDCIRLQAWFTRSNEQESKIFAGVTKKARDPYSDAVDASNVGNARDQTGPTLTQYRVR